MKKEFEDFVKDEGYARITGDIILVTSEMALRLRMYGTEEDNLWSADFSEHPYWLKMSDGVVEGFDTLEKAMNATDCVAVLDDCAEEQPTNVYYNRYNFLDIFGNNAEKRYVYDDNSIDWLWAQAEHGMTIDELSALIQKVAEEDL